MEDKKIKLMTGKVVSDKMNKTVVVEYLRSFNDKKFKKIVCKTKRYKVHDENSSAKTGDTIKFFITRKISKDKYMQLHSVISSSI